MTPHQMIDGAALADRYRTAEPFPHIVLKNVWPADEIAALAASVRAFHDFEGEKDFYGSRRKRYCGEYARLPAPVQAFIDRCHAPEFRTFLEAMTGETGLVADPGLEGGGIHSITAGGFLKVHADFNWHDGLRLYRRLNLLLYLNEGWDPAWGGALELWSRDMKGSVASVPPSANTMVVFTTDDTSFHGHPDPIACPEGVSRNSIALYYYSAAQATDEARRLRHTTAYRSRGLTDAEVLASNAKEKLATLLPIRR